MSAQAIYDDAAKFFTGFEHHIFLSALIGSLSVLVDDEETWLKAVRTALEYMETRKKATVTK